MLSQIHKITSKTRENEFIGCFLVSRKPLLVCPGLFCQCQSFVLRHLVISPVRNTKKLLNLIARLAPKMIKLYALIVVLTDLCVC